jgi:hypothetical protein
MKGKINYSKTIKVDTFNVLRLFGKFKESNDEIEVIDYINEYTFYYIYLTINNVIQNKEKRLTETEIMVMSSLMEKSLDFSLPVDSRDNKLSDLAKDLSTEDNERSANSIYQIVKKLREKGYIMENEDKLLYCKPILNDVRKIVKGQISQKGFATFDYIFKMVISNEVRR